MTHASLHPPRSRDAAVAASFAVFGAGLLWVSTFRNGPGLSFDTAQYFYCASSLVRGDGLQTLGGDPFRLYAPLYVLMLAPGVVLGVELSRFALALNLFSHAGTVFVSFFILRSILRDRWLQMTAMGIISAGYPLLWVGSWALADAPFVFLVTLGFYFTIQLTNEHPRPVDVLLASSVLGFAAIQRYAGAPLLALPLVAIALNRRAVPHPLRWAAGSALVSILPLAIWLLYLVVSAGSAVSHPESHTRWTTALHSSLFTLSFWMDRPRGWAPVAGALAGIALAGNSRSIRRLTNRPMERTAMLSAAFIVLYIGFLLVSASQVHIETPRDRYLAPMYLPLLVLILIAVQVLARLESRFIRNAVLVAFGVFVLGQGHLAALRIAEGLTSDAGGATYLPSRPHRDYSRRTIREAPVVEASRAAYDSGAVVLSNVPQALYLAAGVEIGEGEILTGGSTRLERLFDSFQGDRPVYFVWLRNAEGDHGLRGRVLRQAHFERVYSDDFGMIFELKL